MKNPKLLIIFSFILLVGCSRSKKLYIPLSASQKQDVLYTDSSSIVGLYKYIFATRCNVGGCHDGTFEPNFTTVESAYYTLVYHPINKNNRANTYKYRVLPFDTAHSVLYARISQYCFVNNGDQMPQLSDEDKLSKEQINNVGKWIMEGAKNIDGKTMEIKAESDQ